MSRRAPQLLTALLVVSTLAVYAQVGSHAFLEFDDADYVTDNAMVQSGLTLAGVHWAFAAPHAGNWHPLTWLSHMTDVQVCGVRAGCHLFFNVFLHLASSLLIFRVLFSATKRLAPSIAVGALFALHPIHVESVAWVAERKDVLSTFWCVTTIWLYGRFARQPSARRYVWVVAAFALALLSKPMAVTLPFLLLLLDVWPLGRIQMAVFEKAPLFAMAFAVAIVTFLVQRQAGAVQSTDAFPIGLRLANVPVAYVMYLSKLFWPSHLAVLYPYPQTIPGWAVAASTALIAAITAIVIRFGRTRGYMPVGWFWFLGSLVPVIGIVQVGAQPYADRYAYLPAVGIFIMAAWGVADVVRGVRTRERLAVAASVVIAATLAMITYRQIGYWRDSVTLWEHAVAVTRDNYRAYTNLGFALAEAQSSARAMTAYEAALRINPDYPNAHNYLGALLSERGRHVEAEREIRAALAHRPRFVEAHNNLGLALAGQGRMDAAIAAFEDAVALSPDFGPARNNLAIAYANQGRLDRAVEMFEAALRIQPRSAETHLNLAMALIDTGRPAEAVPHLQAAAALGPESVRTHAQNLLKTLTGR